jgi:hypothetical protein
VTSADPDHLARDAYEAYRAAHPTPLPPWEDIGAQEQAAWKAAVSAIAGQRKVTRPMGDARPVLAHQDRRPQPHLDAAFTVGREGNWSSTTNSPPATTRASRLPAAGGMSKTWARPTAPG